MKLIKHNFANNKKVNNNNIFPLNKSYNNSRINVKKEYTLDNWKNKKINLNFFENKNLIKELRAKYLPDNESHNKNYHEEELNKINNLYKKDYTYTNLENKQQISFSIDNFTKSFQTSLKDNMNNNENYNNKEENDEEITNDKYNLKYNRYSKIYNAKQKYEQIANKKKKKVNSNTNNKNNIIIENRFYTEIINSNILLDKNLKLNSVDDESISLNNLNKKEKNHCSNLHLKNKNLESNRDNNIESSNNKELSELNNVEKIENESNNYYNIKEASINNLKYINNEKNVKNILLENMKMKKEIKNYENLITPLINYINDINRLLNQKEINPNDIHKIIKHENISKSSFYISNLKSNLNESKNDIIFQLFEILKNDKHLKRRRNSHKRKNSKTKRICRSAEDVNNRKNYFYEDTTDKYIFDYYKGRNFECLACQIGNYTSQRGYSPGICFHIDKENKKD